MSWEFGRRTQGCDGKRRCRSMSFPNIVTTAFEFEAHIMSCVYDILSV